MQEDQEIRPVDEIEAEISRSNDKERAIGLIAAPVAAIVGLIISSASVNYAKTHNQSVGVYEKLTYVLLGLAVLILLTSWLRKRLFQGITLALFGLAIFQLHYTYVGFAAPFLLVGAWYLVRAYRLQQELKRAEAGRSRRATTQGESERCRAATPPQQALHAALLNRPRAAGSSDAGVMRCSGSRGHRRRGGLTPAAQQQEQRRRAKQEHAAKTAGKTNTPADECSVATMDAGETRAGSPGTATAATVEPGRWNVSPGSGSP